MWFCSNLSHFRPRHLRLELAEKTRWRDIRPGLKERCEAYWETDMYTSTHACLGVRRLHAHKWAASCHDNFTSSFFMLLYCWMCCCSAGESDYLHRLDRGRERYKPQGKPIISQNLCIVRCITSRAVYQNLLPMEFLTKSDFFILVLWRYDKQSGASNAHSSMYLCGEAELHPLFCSSTTRSTDFQWWACSVHLMEKVHCKLYTYCYFCFAVLSLATLHW